MQPSNMPMSGVVDLAAVKAAGEAKQKAEEARARNASGDQGAVSPTSLVIDVDEASFEKDVLQRSAEVPVVIDFWAEWCEPCKQLGPALERLAHAYAGRFVLAKVDVDQNSMLFQQFGVQGIPAVFAVIAGQALPLFQGAAPEQQIREVLDQLIQAAEERFGIVGAPVDPSAEEAGEAQQSEPEEPSDPVLAAAEEALQAGDAAGAAEVYRKALLDNPGNTEAKLGLTRAELLGRVMDLDANQVRKDAADKRDDLDAQLRVADLDLVGGHVEDAFGRLVEFVRRSAGEDRNAARVRLLELFEVVGPEDPRVAPARAALARVLF